MQKDYDHLALGADAPLGDPLGADAPLGAPLGAEGGDDDVAEGDPESSSSSSSSRGSEEVHSYDIAGGDDDDEIAEGAAWIQRGYEEVHSYHIAEFDLSRVPECVPESDPPPALDPGPPPPAAPAPPPSKCDETTLTEPVPPHTLPLDATQSDRHPSRICHRLTLLRVPR